MTTARSKKIIGLAAIGVTVLLSLILVSIPVDAILASIGIKNAYLFVYLIAFAGSITTFASIPYPLILLSMVAGGLNPVLAGSLSALGVTTSDTCTFVAARRGRVLLPAHLTRSLESAAHRLEKHPALFYPALVLYGVLSPLSNDFAVISLSLMEYSFWRVIPVLAMGNLIYNVGIAFLGLYAYDWITSIV